MRQAPYGSWTSPISTELVASGDGRPGFLGAVGDELWWTEPRPLEAGRRTLVRRRADGTAESVLPAPWNVRNRVHEYGGTPWAAASRADGSPLVVFTDFDDQRMYAFEPDGAGEPVPLTPPGPVASGLRWCEPVVDLERGQVWAVLEEFTGQRPTELRRVLAAVPLDGSAADDRSAVRELTDDAFRFTTGPRVSPDGGRVAWIVWNHPRMPWDETELRVAEIDADGRLRAPRTLAGGDGESIAQIEWAGDGSLVYAGDRTGWWNLYRSWPDDPDPRPLFAARSEFAGPMWTLGTRWFTILDDGRVAALQGRGESVLAIIGDEGVHESIGGRWSEWAPGLASTGTKVYGLAASPFSGYEVVEYDVDADQARVVAAAHEDRVDPAYYPVPQDRTFDGPGGREVHAHVYPPRNPEYQGPEGEAPPYVVWVHGGPTSHVRAVLDLELAYFTSRGIGVVEVNYGGSTGYGREYRERLRGQWGVVDVEDCAAAARALADSGEADGSRLAIRGGSAGGWTAAASLTSPAAAGLYACAVVKYPILTLSGWTGDRTHDFESQYVYSLVAPEGELERLSAERSPVDNADRIAAPFVLLQGLEDRICPPEQCELLLERIEGKGVAHAYLTFEGEQHGFRRAATIERAIEAEHSLYSQVFGFDAPQLERVELLQ